MQYDDFIKLTKESEPSNKLSGVHLAIWYAVKDNWDMAHKITQDIHTETASLIHAYLHRVERDTSNANYWYRRARKDPFSGTFNSELDNIIKTIFTSK